MWNPSCFEDRFVDHVRLGVIELVEVPGACSCPATGISKSFQVPFWSSMLNFTALRTTVGRVSMIQSGTALVLRSLRRGSHSERWLGAPKYAPDVGDRRSMTPG